MSESSSNTEAIVAELMSDLQRRREGHRFLGAVDMDRVVAALLRLTMEISALRDRMDTYEKLSAAGQPINDQAVDQFVPDDTNEARRLDRRKTFITRLIRDLSSTD